MVEPVYEDGVPNFAFDAVVAIDPCFYVNDFDRLTFAFELARAAGTKLYVGDADGPVCIVLPKNKHDAQAVIDLAKEFNKKMVEGVTTR